MWSPYKFSVRMRTDRLIIPQVAQQHWFKFSFYNNFLNLVWEARNKNKSLGHLLV